MNARSTIPVHLLTGFLGSGKTTLLNRALASRLGPETAVIVNEFGEIGLDQVFIASRSEETVVLKSGCICCAIRTDLVTTLMRLAAMAADGTAAFTRIVVETSGISDPVPILNTLVSDFNLLTRFHVGSVVCAVDTAAADETRRRKEAAAQVAVADICILTKVDLADDGMRRAAEAWVRAINPLAEVGRGAGDDLAAWIEMHEERRADLPTRLAALDSAPGGGDPGHGVRSIVLRPDAGRAPGETFDKGQSFSSGQTLSSGQTFSSSQSWPAFAVWLSALVHLHGDRILRVKGMLRDAGRDRWIAVHGVGRFLHPPEHLDARRAPPGGACLVFITDGLDPKLIEASYRRWVLARDRDVAHAAPSPHPPLARPSETDAKGTTA